MASNRTKYEIAGLIFITIISIVLLVLVGITFSKVNKPQAEAPTNKPTSPTSTTAPKERTYNYEGNMDTQEAWNDFLNSPGSDEYREDVIKYTADITDALNSTYPTAVVNVTGFQESSASSKRYVNDKAPQADTVIVLFTTDITTDNGPPNPTEVKDTINDNINKTSCNDCSVTKMDLQLRSTTMPPTSEPTGSGPTRSSHTSSPHSVSSTTTTSHSPGEYVAAEYLISNMDERYHPCEDFYKFACGNFTNNHPTPDGVVGYGTFDVVQDRVGDTIYAHLQKINMSDPQLTEWQMKVKVFYDSCTDRNQRGDRDNRKLRQYIDELGGWPMIMKKGSWNEKNFNLAKVLATLLGN
jgi:hypothetical protein